MKLSIISHDLHEQIWVAHVSCNFQKHFLIHVGVNSWFWKHTFDKTVSHQGPLSICSGTFHYITWSSSTDWGFSRLSHQNWLLNLIPSGGEDHTTWLTARDQPLNDLHLCHSPGVQHVTAWFKDGGRETEKHTDRTRLRDYFVGLVVNTWAQYTQVTWPQLHLLTSWNRWEHREENQR